MEIITSLLAMLLYVGLYCFVFAAIELARDYFNKKG